MNAPTRLPASVWRLAGWRRRLGVVLATHNVYVALWLPGLVAVVAAFFLYLLWDNAWRWIPMMTFFTGFVTWALLDGYHVLRGWDGAPVAAGTAFVVVAVMRWLELKGWLTWDDDA